MIRSGIISHRDLDVKIEHRTFQNILLLHFFSMEDLDLSYELTKEKIKINQQE